MKIHRALLIVSLSFLLISGLGACFKMDQKTVLMPDGSGKVVMTIAMKLDLSAMAGMMGAAAGEEGESVDVMSDFQDPAKIEKQFEGAECFLPPESSKDGDWNTTTLTAYFKDINKLKIKKEKKQGGNMGDAKAEPEIQVTAFKYSETEEGYRLVITDESLDEMTNQGKQPEGQDEQAAEMAKQMAKAMAQMMKTMLDGMEFRISVKVPGAIVTCKGFTEHEGGDATLKIDDDMLVAAMSQDEEMMKKMAEIGDIQAVTWKKHTVTEEEVEAFKKEMKDAAKAWETYKKEYAEKQKATTEEK